MKVDYQLELLKLIIELKEKYPDYKIIFCVDNNELTDDYSWTEHELSFVEVSYYYKDTYGHIYIYEDEIKDYFELLLCDTIKDDLLLEKEIQKKFDTEVSQVICVHTKAKS
jgi:hypothetical protein